MVPSQIRPATLALATSALALSAAVAAASFGCGLGKNDDTDGQRLNDGVSPWVQHGNLELCIDGALLGADDGGDPGVCSAADVGRRGCEADGDCQGDESCVCGSCTARLCQFTSECPTGLSCVGNPRRCARRCTEDVDCPVTQLCDVTVCRTPCVESTECAAGEVCLAGLCGSIGCGPDAPPCGPGESCALQRRAGIASAPAALAADGQTVLYVGLTDPDGQQSILRAGSVDGLRFVADPAEPVLVAAAGGQLGAPSPLVLPDGSTALFYELDGGSIGRAMSTDGRRFAPGDTVLEATEAWHDGRVGAPGAVVVEGTVMLFYEGGDAAGIGLAIGPPTGPFRSASAEPFVSPTLVEDAERWSGVVRVGAPWPVVVETVLGERELRLFFGGRALTLPARRDAGPDDSIAVAITRLDDPAAPALERWPHNPVFARTRNFEPLQEADPSVVTRDGVSWMYFASDEGLHVARHPPR